MKTKIEINYEDYAVNDKDDDTMVSIKEAIDSLKPAEKKIWMTYVESGSYAATARAYNVSAPTAKSYLTQIKKKIMDYAGLDY